MARLPGVSRAAPTPWSTLVTMSTVGPGAAAQAADATVNHTTPTTNTRRRPKWSPSEPPSSRRAANDRVYPVTTHWRVPSGAWNWRPMVGRAIPTTVASIEAMPDPSTVAPITHRPAADPKRTPPVTCPSTDAPRDLPEVLWPG